MPFYYNKQTFNNLDNRQKCLVSLDVKTFDPVTPMTEEEMYMLHCNIGAFLNDAANTEIDAFLQGSVSTTTVFIQSPIDIADLSYFGFDLTPYLIGPYPLVNPVKYIIQGSKDTVSVTSVYINPCTILALKDTSDDSGQKTLVTMKGGSLEILEDMGDVLALLPDAP